jgi:hypothetical protein
MSRARAIPFVLGCRSCAVRSVTRFYKAVVDDMVGEEECMGIDGTGAYDLKSTICTSVL